MAAPTPKNFVKSTNPDKSAYIGANTRKSTMSIRDLIKPQNKTVKFLGGDLKIKKLTLGEVTKIQELVRDNQDEDGEASAEKSLQILRTVIAMSADGADMMTNEDFDNIPMDDLSKLSGEIMTFSGMNAPKGK